MSRKIAAAVTLAGVAALTGWLPLAGCIPGSGPGTIGFNLPPTPIITVDLTRGVAPLTVTFSSELSSDDGLIIDRLWDFGDGTTSRDVSPVHVFTQVGSYVVTLTLTDDRGATASRTVTIEVTNAPVAVIRVDRTASETAPAIINFDGSESFDPDGEIVSYRWDFGDGSTEIIPVVPHTYTRPGTYRARLTVTDNTGITGTAQVLISIGIKPPFIELRIPPPALANVVVSPNSPLWIQGIFDVEPGVPRTIRAGLDGDRDICGSQSVLLDADAFDAVGLFEGHGSAVTDVAYSPSGAFVLTSSLDGTLRLHSASNGDIVGIFNAEGEVNCVAFSPDGTSFAYGQANGTVVLRTIEGPIVRELTGHTAAVRDVDFSANGDFIVSASADRRAIAWRVADGAIHRDLLHDLALNAAAFSPFDVNIIATGGEDNLIRIWNGTSVAVTLTGHAAPVQALAFTPDGLGLFSGSSDRTARLWSPVAGVLVQTYSGHNGDVLSLAVSSDGQRLATGSTDARVRLFDSATGTSIRSNRPCASPISGLAFSPDDELLVAGVAARNDIQLDTDPPNGNDLNITYPRALQLRNVAALGGGNVAPGTYNLWAEIDTDRSDPQRAYANATISVVPEFTSTIDAQNVPPVVPFVNGVAEVVVNPSVPRQIFDLGPMTVGDRLFISLMTTPGFGETYSPPGDFSLIILDGDQNIYAWYQPDFILFSSEAKLIIGRSSPSYYIVTDGGFSVRVRVERATGLFQPRQQRIFVNFEGVNGLNVGSPGQNIPPLLAPQFNDFFTPAETWGAPETVALRAAVMTTLRQKFSGIDVVFTGSNESSTPPAIPFQTLHVGGSALDLFGVADYVDPRNQTQSGSGVVYAVSIGEFTIENPFLLLPVNNEFDLGRVIGEVAAHEVGHMVGLRHTDTPDDIMQAFGPNADDITVPRIFRASPPTAFEQFFGVPPIGIQDAPGYMLEVIGGN